jgi:asparagine synthase (glutamine-hydrolysing)
MCGIAGILDTCEGRAIRAEEVASMVRPLAHRGPDGVGVRVDGAVGLGHSRLAIIDTAGGAQPMANEDESVWVVFNGEIFNYLELRESLQRAGHVFRTRSDTEVIPHLYEEYGDELVHHLNGQFAIALWDARRRRLLLVRDRVGIRPLFYLEWQERLFFASEIKALFRGSGLPRRIDQRALAEVFTYWSPLAPSTFFENVFSVPPGHMLSIERGRRDLRRYWDWTFPEPVETRRETDWVEELRALLVDAVRLQLRADVPVGTLLSGGLDSSIIASLVHSCSDAPLRTFSVRFEDGEFDEGPYQREMVRHLGIEHTDWLCRGPDIADALPQAIWHSETALVRTAPVPMMLLSAQIRAAGYRVVLSGEGADEAFAGYDIFKEARVRRFCARQPGSRSRPLLFGRLYPYLAHSPASATALSHKFFQQGSSPPDRPSFAHEPRWAATRRAWRFFSDELLSSLRDWDPAAAVERLVPSDSAGWNPLARDQYVEAHTLLSGYLLSSQGDRMAMAHGVEGRFPFLDHRVIELANRMPAGLKLRGLTEKFVLKKAARGWIPDLVRDRTKQPYRAPDTRSFWARGDAPEYVSTLLSPRRLSEAGYFEPTVVAQLLEKCRVGRAIGFGDNVAFVGILTTMLADALFVRGETVPGVKREAPEAGERIGAIDVVA